MVFSVKMVTIWWFLIWCALSGLSNWTYEVSENLLHSTCLCQLILRLFPALLVLELLKCFIFKLPKWVPLLDWYLRISLFSCSICHVITIHWKEKRGEIIVTERRRIAIILEKKLVECLVLMFKPQLLLKCYHISVLWLNHRCMGFCAAEILQNCDSMFSD